MKKRNIILVMLVLCIVVTSLFGLVACKEDQTKIIMLGLDVYMENDYYLATQTKGSSTLDLSKVFEGATGFAYTGDELTVSGNTATMVQEGEGTLKFTQGGVQVEKKIFVVEGENVFSEEEMRAALDAEKNVVIHVDIATKTKETFETKAKVYGNGHELDATATSDAASVFTASGRGGHIQDLKIMGIKIENGKEVILENFVTKSALISISNVNADANGDYPDVFIKNCIIENGHKLVSINGGDVTIEGCIIRNSSDALIATGTDYRKGSTITLKNNVLSTSIVAGFLFYGYNTENGGTKGNSQQTLNIEGFLDIYNWKRTDGMKLMPPNEPAASLVNNQIPGQIKKKEFQKYLKDGPDGKKYVHSGIIILSTSSSVKQTPTINGLENIGYTIKEFPIPPFAKLIANTCQLASYDETKSDYAVKPGVDLKNDPQLFEELRYGRA